MKNPIQNVYAIILAGGSGTRLWPFSRETLPKQLLRFNDTLTLLQATAKRLTDIIPAHQFITVTQQKLQLEVKRMLNAVHPDLDNNILIEPLARNTLPAIAWATYTIAASNPDAILTVFPSDHVIGNLANFHKALNEAIFEAEKDKICLLGILPTEPSTAYGYIHAPTAVGDARDVLAFKEKPDAHTAAGYLKSGEYFWNGGMFIYKAAILIEMIERLQPELAKTARHLAQSKSDLADEKIYREFPNLSIDHGIMEKASNLKVIPVDMGWTDLGGWNAVYHHMPKDAHQNVAVGDILQEDCHGNLLWTEDKPLAVMGAKNMAIVQMRDVTLICPRSEADHLKNLLPQVEKKFPLTMKFPTMENRPWGQFTTLNEGPNFKVKRIIVDPGKKLSLQKHEHRSEHWIVLSGKATIEVDDEIRILKSHESTYIPAGSRHRLANEDQAPLEIIEIQSGIYLGEDDIMRFKDDYGRS